MGEPLSRMCREGEKSWMLLVAGLVVPPPQTLRACENCPDLQGPWSGWRGQFRVLTAIAGLGMSVLPPRLVRDKWPRDSTKRVLSRWAGGSREGCAAGQRSEPVDGAPQRFPGCLHRRHHGKEDRAAHTNAIKQIRITALILEW